MAVTVKAVALYDNEGEDKDELSFKCNDTLTIIQENWQQGWHLCQLGTKRGLAPANYLQLVRLAPTVQTDDIYDCPRTKQDNGNLYINTRAPPISSTDSYVSMKFDKNRGVGSSFDDELGTYVLPEEYDDDDDDVYVNTSNLMDTSSRSNMSTLSDRSSPRKSLTEHPSPPRRPIPDPLTSPENLINYPPVPASEYKPPSYSDPHKPLQSQYSEYLDMANFPDELPDYDEVPDHSADLDSQDYDEVPEQIYDIVPDKLTRSSDESISNKVSKESLNSGNSSKRSNESLHSRSKSNDGAFQRSSDSLHSTKFSMESINSHRSSDSSSYGGRRNSPPSIPPKLFPHPQHSASSDENNTADYMTPAHKNNGYKAASDVITLDSSIEYMDSAKANTLLKKNKNSPDKRKKATTPLKAQLDRLNNEQLPRLFSTLRREKKGSPEKQLGHGNSFDNGTIKKSKSCDKINQHSVRPLPQLPDQITRTAGESTQQSPIDYASVRNRPLPPPPTFHEPQDYDEIDEGPDYAEVPNLPDLPDYPDRPHPPPPMGRPQIPGPPSQYKSSTRPELMRQRSRSVTNSPVIELEEGEERRHSTPDRPDLLHDYSELPDELPASFNSSGLRSTSGSESSGGSTGGYAGRSPYYPTPHGPSSGTTREHLAPPTNLGPSRTVSVYSPTTLSKLPTTYTPPATPFNPPPPPTNPPPLSPYNTHRPSLVRDPKDEPDHTSETPPELLLEKMHLSTSLSSHDISLMDERSISPLLVNITTPLIKFTQCSNDPKDTKQADSYVEFCKMTATACITMVGHLHFLTQTIEHKLLRMYLQNIRQQLYDGTKLLIEATKTARLQFPALVAQNEMICRRNELIATIREVKVCFKTVIDINPNSH